MPDHILELPNYILELLGLNLEWAQEPATGLSVSIYVPSETVSASELLAAAQILNSISSIFIRNGLIESSFELQEVTLASLGLKTVSKVIAGSALRIIEMVIAGGVLVVVSPSLPGHSSPPAASPQEICRVLAQNSDGSMIYREYFCRNGSPSGIFGVKNPNALLPFGTTFGFHFATPNGENVFKIELIPQRTY